MRPGSFSNREKTERQLLDHVVPHRCGDGYVKRSRFFYITKLARPGGYLARADDPPPDNKGMWHGLPRLTDIELGFNATKLVGNWRLAVREMCSQEAGESVRDP
jgi:hypothetical protein